VDLRHPDRADGAAQVQVIGQVDRIVGQRHVEVVGGQAELELRPGRGLAHDVELLAQIVLERVGRGDRAEVIAGPTRARQREVVPDALVGALDVEVGAVQLDPERLRAFELREEVGARLRRAGIAHTPASAW
jgi:hypothetical protein